MKPTAIAIEVNGAGSRLEFTPLEFETYIVDSEIVQSSELEFTPLEFETKVLWSIFYTSYIIRIYSVGV